MQLVIKPYITGTCKEFKFLKCNCNLNGYFSFLL